MVNNGAYGALIVNDTDGLFVSNAYMENMGGPSAQFINTSEFNFVELSTVIGSAAMTLDSAVSMLERVV